MAFGNNCNNGTVTESARVEITARSNQDEVGHVRRAPTTVVLLVGDGSRR